MSDKSRLPRLSDQPKASQMEASGEAVSPCPGGLREWAWPGSCLTLSDHLGRGHHWKSGCGEVVL